MACTLEATQTALCTSGIGKVNGRVQLLQLVAQTLCGASLNPPDPYDNRLVYIQQGGAEAIIENPTGAYNLTALVPKVTEIHCHNAPNITSLTCTGDALLTVVDLQNCALLKTIVFTSCTALASLDLSTFTSLTTLNVQSCTAMTSLNISNLVTVTSHLDIVFLAVPNLSGPALVSVGGNLSTGGANATGTLSFPLLQTVGGGIQNGGGGHSAINFNSLQSVGTYLLFNSNLNLISASFPALTSGTNFCWFNGSTSLQTVNIPGMVSADNLSFNSCTSLTSVNLSALGTCPLAEFNNCTALTSISLPVLADCLYFTTDLSPIVSLDIATGMVDGGEYYLTEGALDEASVDAVLQGGIDAGMFSGIIYTYGGTSSAPSVAGDANKTQLLLDGVDVQTN